MITFCNDIYAKNDVSTILKKTYIHSVISKNDVYNMYTNYYFAPPQIIVFTTSNLSRRKLIISIHVNICWRQLV